MKKIFLTIVLLFAAVVTSQAQTWTPTYPVNIDATNFPDATFRQWVLDNVDTDADTQLSEVEANRIVQISFTYSSNEAKNITDLKGVEYFSRLRLLSCYATKTADRVALKTADLRKNTQLEIVSVAIANVETLLLPSSVTSIDCSNNYLTELDLTSCPNLTKVICSQNYNISVLDVSNALQLNELNCRYNKIAVLDVTKNTQLIKLNCSVNQLSELDVTKNTQLTELECSNNKLSTLDVTKNLQLGKLLCNSNKITELDVTKNTQLNQLECFGNNLSELDVTKNTLLTRLVCYNNKNISELDVTNCTKLTYLTCHQNKISELDVTKCPDLNYLSCSSNNIAELDVTKCTKLTDLVCFGNKLSGLDVSQNTALQKLQCYANYITHLDLQCPNLTELTCYSNSLIALDCSTLSKLKTLKCYDQRRLFSVEPVFNASSNSFRIQMPASPQILLANVTDAYRYDNGTQKTLQGYSKSSDGSRLTSINWLTGYTQDIYHLAPQASGSIKKNGVTYTYNVPIHPSASLNTSSSTAMDVSIALEPFYATYLNPAAKVNNSSAGALKDMYMGTCYIGHYAENPYAEYSNAQVRNPITFDQTYENVGWMQLNLLTGTGYIPANRGFVVLNDKPGYVIFRAPYVYEKTNRGISGYTPRTSLSDWWKPAIVTGTIDAAGIAVKWGEVLTLGRRTDDGSGTLGFWNFSGYKINPYRAYIPKDKIPSAAQNNTRFQGFDLRFTDEFGDEILLDDSAITGITGAETNAAGINAVAASPVFDLQGRRVANPQKGGVYVVNGKKVMM